MDHKPLVFLITGARKGIGEHQVQHYLAQGIKSSVVAASRQSSSQRVIVTIVSTYRLKQTFVRCLPRFQIIMDGSMF